MMPGGVFAKEPSVPSGVTPIFRKRPSSVLGTSTEGGDGVGVGEGVPEADGIGLHVGVPQKLEVVSAVALSLLRDAAGSSSNVTSCSREGAMHQAEGQS